MVAKDEAVTRAAEFLKEVAYLDRSESVVMLPETAIEFTYGMDRPLRLQGTHRNG
ncbi:hypothetical protein ACFCX7_18615 [Streptomyces microflavus]|uniref:hypothetical protein n=1 Tax=Streptomyces microflavus TaxID=1919 RepID=UPI0035D86785